MPRRNWLAECLRLDRLLIAMQNQRVIKYCSLSPLNLCTIDFNPSNFLRLVSEPHSKWHFKMAYINSDTNPAKKKVFKWNPHIIISVKTPRDPYIPPGTVRSYNICISCFATEIQWSRSHLAFTCVLTDRITSGQLRCRNVTRIRALVPVWTLSNIITWSATKTYKWMRDEMTNEALKAAAFTSAVVVSPLSVILAAESVTFQRVFQTLSQWFHIFLVLSWFLIFLITVCGLSDQITVRLWDAFDRVHTRTTRCPLTIRSPWMHANTVPSVNGANVAWISLNSSAL